MRNNTLKLGQLGHHVKWCIRITNREPRWTWRCWGGVSLAEPVLLVSDWGSICGVVRALSLSGVLCTSPPLSSPELESKKEPKMMINYWKSAKYNMFNEGVLSNSKEKKSWNWNLPQLLNIDPLTSSPVLFLPTFSFNSITYVSTFSYYYLPTLFCK